MTRDSTQLLRAERLHLAAKEANGRGRPAQAEAKIHRALALLQEYASVHDVAQQEAVSHTESLRARLLIALAWAEFDMQGMARGEPTVRRALEVAVASGDLGAVALAHHQHGLLLARSGSLDEAMPELDEAVALIGHVPDEERPPFYLNRGNVRLMRGLIRPAREDFGRCRVLAKAQGMTRLESKALANLGYVQYVSGNLAAALDVLTTAQTLDVDVSQGGLLDRARILMEAGLLDEADDALSRVGEMLRRRRANQERAEANLVRAEVALMQQRWTDARSLSLRASREFRRRQGLGWQAKADLAYWQALLEIKGGPSRVVKEVTRARGSMAQAGRNPHDPSDPSDPSNPSDISALDRSARRHLELVAAEAHLAIGQPIQASALLDLAGRVGSSEPLTTRLRENLVRAGVARAAGEPARARRELSHGLGALSKAQARYQSLDLRTAMAVHGNRLARLDLTMALESGRPTAVFESLERWRAMSHRRTAVTSPADMELADLVTQLRAVVEELRSTPSGTLTDPVQRRKTTLERQVREREWRLQGEGLPERSTSLTTMRPVLQQRHTDLIAYYVMDKRLGAVTVRDGRASVVTLAPWSAVEALMSRVRADLDALAGPLLPDPLRQAIAQSLGHDLENVDRVLIPPGLGETQSLLVVPSRTLGTVPWSLLPHRRGRPTTVSLSSTSWLRGLTLLGHQPRVTAVAGPGLLLSGREIVDVAAHWPMASVVASTAGTAGGLARAMVTQDLVHVAAHGSHNHENPLFSSIRLADGPLYAYDIPADETVASHIVLSACDLGLLTPRSGGEVLGLTAALLSIGARCVVSGVSRIDDQVAYGTMVRYHARLASGEDSATALAGAVESDLTAPAAFVSFGSPWRVG